MNYLITFLAVFVTDILNTYYIQSITDNRPLIASMWATVVTLTASIAVINFTHDTTMLIPALLGAFCGTYVAMKFKRKCV